MGHKKLQVTAGRPKTDVATLVLSWSFVTVGVSLTVGISLTASAPPRLLLEFRLEQLIIFVSSFLCCAAS